MDSVRTVPTHLIHSFVHPFIYLFIHSLIRSLMFLILYFVHFLSSAFFALSSAFLCEQVCLSF